MVDANTSKEQIYERACLLDGSEIIRTKKRFKYWGNFLKHCWFYDAMT